MHELELKYGCNPNQKPARIFRRTGGRCPWRSLTASRGTSTSWTPLNSWQLVKELKEATGLPAAASFKHVSPAGAAVGLPLSDTDRAIYFVEPDAQLTPIACAYIRARGADRLCSYGDWAALSDTCDAATAAVPQGGGLRRGHRAGLHPRGPGDPQGQEEGEVQRGEDRPQLRPRPQEHKDVFGITFEQGRNNFKIDESLLENWSPRTRPCPSRPRWT